MTFSAKDGIRIVTAIALGYALWQAVTLPLLDVTQLYIFSDEISLIGIISGLWDGAERPLAALILLIGVIAPFGKCLMLGLFRLPHGSAKANIFAVLNIFSSLDAFIIALTIFFVKISGLSTAETREGVVWLIGFVLVSKVAEYAFVNSQHKK